MCVGLLQVVSLDSLKMPCLVLFTFRPRVASPRAKVTYSFLALGDQLSRASQVATHFLLCGDLSGNIHTMVSNHLSVSLTIFHVLFPDSDSLVTT